MKNLLSSKRETRYASEASWRAPMALDWNRLIVSFEDGVNQASLQIGLEVLSDLSNKSLEREFPNQQLGRSTISSATRGGELDLLLIPPDLSQSDGTGPVPVRLLDTSWGLRGGLSGGLGSDWSLAEHERGRASEVVARMVGKGRVYVEPRRGGKKGEGKEGREEEKWIWK
jgi:hypothetical protein